MKNIFIIICSLFTSLAAATSNSGLYLSGKIGDSIVNFHNSKLAVFKPPSDNKAYPDKNENDAVFSGSIALGYDFSEKFNVPIRSELELSMREKAETQYNIYFPEAPSTTSKVKNNARLNTLMLNTYYDFKNQTSFTPYISVGIGLARADYNRILLTTVNDPNKPIDFKLSKTDTINNFAWTLGLGSQYSINENLALDLSYRYLDAGKYQITEEYVDNDRNKTETNIRTHDIMFGLVYRF